MNEYLYGTVADVLNRHLGMRSLEWAMAQLRARFEYQEVHVTEREIETGMLKFYDEEALERYAELEQTRRDLIDSTKRVWEREFAMVAKGES